MKHKKVIEISLILAGVASVILLNDATFFLFAGMVSVALMVDKGDSTWDEQN